MTDRYAGFIVTLDKDYREDDSEKTISAIKQIKGVLSVDPIVSDVNFMIAQQRTKLEIINMLMKIIDEMK